MSASTLIAVLVLPVQGQTKSLIPVPRIQFLSTSGTPLSNGHVHTYISLTTTAQATYTDSGGGTPNANPVPLDSGGFAGIWLTPGEVYTIALHDSGDVQQWSVDGVTSGLLDTSLVVGTTAVTFTSTPTFNSATSTYFSITLTGNVTSSTISNASDGRVAYFNICQDATGGRTFTWDAAVLNGPTIGSGASVCTSASFIYDGTNWREQAPSSRGSAVFDSIQNNGIFIIPEDGGACSFQMLPGVNWQICSNIKDLQIEHFNSGGDGRFHVNADFLVGPPGSATVSENFNSFAWDNEGSYWDGSQARFNLWEIAVGTTPNSGTPINSRLNMWPLFTGACAGCTADIALGASGTNPVRGNPTGPPMWVFNILPRDGFSVVFTHSAFTANRTYTFPNVNGALVTTNSFVQHITGTAALNLAAPGAVPGCVDSGAVTIVGAAVGDNIVPSMSVAMQANQQMRAFVSAVDTLIFRVCQFVGTATDPDGAGATYRADIWKH